MTEAESIKILTRICQQTWKTKQQPTNWKCLMYIPTLRKRDAKECINYRSTALIFLQEKWCSRYYNKDIAYMEYATNIRIICLCFIDYSGTFWLYGLLKTIEHSKRNRYVKMFWLSWCDFRQEVVIAQFKIMDAYFASDQVWALSISLIEFILQKYYEKTIENTIFLGKLKEVGKQEDGEWDRLYKWVALSL